MKTSETRAVLIVGAILAVALRRTNVILLLHGV